MGNREIVEGALPPLFERLRVGATSEDDLPVRAFTAGELRESVRRELEGLLNTRSPVPPADFLAADLTVVDYGVPDLTAFAPASSDDRATIAALVARAIGAFEPRLQAVDVAVAPVPGQPEQLLATTSAALVVAGSSERVRIAAALFPGAYGHQVTLEPAAG